jgi:hypothetical protein
MGAILKIRVFFCWFTVTTLSLSLPWHHYYITFPLSLHYHCHYHILYYTSLVHYSTIIKSL